MLKTSLAACALVLTTLLAGCGQGDSGSKGLAPSFKSVDITGAPYATTLALPDADGKMRDLSEFKGKVVFVFFGYTQCPDVCPTTMAEIAQIKKQLGADGAKVQGVFVTVDPERDTAEVVKAYVASFGPDMIGLRPDDEAQLKAAALHFKVYFTKEKGPTPTSYLVNHTAASFVFDPQGRVRLFTRYGAKTEDLLHDVKQLLR